MRKNMVSLGLAVALLVCMMFALTIAEAAPKHAKAKHKQAEGRKKQVKGKQKAERKNKSRMKGRMRMKTQMNRGHSKLAMLRPLLMNNKMRTGIGVSATQVAQLKTLLLEDEKGGIKAHAQIRILEIDLRELMGDDSPNLTKIDAKIDELNKARAEEQKRSIHAALAARKILTSEQLDKLKTAMRKQMREKMHGQGMRKNMRGMRRGGKMGRGTRPHGKPPQRMQPEHPGAYEK